MRGYNYLDNYIICIITGNNTYYVQSFSIDSSGTKIVNLTDSEILAYQYRSEEVVLDVSKSYILPESKYILKQFRESQCELITEIPYSSIIDKYSKSIRLATRLG